MIGGLACAAALALALVLASPAAAAPGDRDPTFSQDGIVEVPLGVADMALQPDGRIVVVGFANAGNDWTVGRFMPDGAPDTSFGAGGVVTTEFPGRSEARASALMLAPDGDIVVAGRAIDAEPSDCSSSAPCQYLALARYNADGSLDEGFSEDGTDTSDPSGFWRVGDIAPAADGGFAIAATTGGGFAVARRLADGSPDASFGGDGLVELFFDDYTNPAANAVVVQPDGRVVAAGSTTRWEDRLSFTQMTMVRLEQDGSLDESFGEEGVQILASSTRDESAEALIRLADGRLLAAGYASLARYGPDGELDPTFGEGGIAETTPGAAEDATLDSSGRIVLAGRSYDESQVRTGNDFWTARFAANGEPDAGFGQDGAVKTDHLGRADWARAVAVQGDGRVLSAGGGLIVRYLTEEGPADADADGFGDTVDGCAWAYETGGDGCPGPYARELTEATFRADAGDQQWFEARLESAAHGACAFTESAQLVRRGPKGDQIVTPMDTDFALEVKHPLARRGEYRVVVPEWIGPRVGTCAAAESEPIVLKRHQRMVELEYSRKTDKLVAHVRAPEGAGRCLRRERVVLTYVEGPPYAPIKADAGLTDNGGRIRFERPRPLVDPASGEEPATYFATVRRSPRCAGVQSFGESAYP